MKIGCFALVEPFSPMERQFEAIAEMGITYADLTDNHNGGMLGVEYGFTASLSLDSHPQKIRKMVDNAGITLTSVCAHANLLDPPSPDRYGTHDIIKAIRLAKLLDIKHVITTEGDPKTAFGENLTRDQQIFSICEKLHEPLQWAVELGVELLIEPHGQVTDTIDGMASILDTLGHEENLGICLDTGNSWLGGSEPLDFVKEFGPRIKHVHWKDMPVEMVDKRGKMFGCGMAVIPLGDGVVGIESIVKELNKIGFDSYTTLEIAGVDNVKESIERLKRWS
ncbi:MAG: sugar phosphate isomerase/epimerase [Phycisphaerae bacterium]|nr:sugar phosphate isomerase/epimerase [Phycisphaerae bacterium]